MQLHYLQTWQMHMAAPHMLRCTSPGLQQQADSTDSAGASTSYQQMKPEAASNHASTEYDTPAGHGTAAPSSLNCHYKQGLPTSGVPALSSLK